MIRKIVLVLLAFIPLAAEAQLYPLFGPSTGIMKGDPTTPVTASAVSTDVTGLFCGTSTTNFLRADGTCAVPSGSGVSSVAQTVPAGFAVAGTPVTGTGTLAISYATGQTANRILATPDGTTGALSLRALVAGDVPPINLGSTANGGVSGATILLGTNGGTSNGFFSVTGPTTALRTFTFPNASATVLTDNALVTVTQGGSGANTLTNHGVLVGSGTSPISAIAAMASDNVLMGVTGANPSAVAIGNCGDATHAISYNTTTHAWGCQAISAGTGTVTNVATGTGLTGGPITTTGTLSVDQSFSPTWTGTQTFTPSGTSPITINHNSGASLDLTITGSGASGIRGSVVNTTNSNGAYAGWDLADSSGALFQLHIYPPATASAPFTGGLTGEQLVIGTSANVPVSIGTSGVERIRLTGAGALSGYGATAGTVVDMSPDTGSFTGTLTGMSGATSGTVTWSKMGQLVTITIASVTGTSNTTAMTMTGLPASLEPATQRQLVPINLIDGGSNVAGYADITNGSTTVTFARIVAATGVYSPSGFTNSGSKGLSLASFTYSLK